MSLLEKNQPSGYERIVGQRTHELNDALFAIGLVPVHELKSTTRRHSPEQFTPVAPQTLEQAPRLVTAETAAIIEDTPISATDVASTMPSSTAMNNLNIEEIRAMVEALRELPLSKPFEAPQDGSFLGSTNE